jgi:hypothetical protein
MLKSTAAVCSALLLELLLLWMLVGEAHPAMTAAAGQACNEAYCSACAECVCCAVLCCAVLCCAVLCCAVLCCAVLCCVAAALPQLPLGPQPGSAAGCHSHQFSSPLPSHSVHWQRPLREHTGQGLWLGGSPGRVRPLGWGWGVGTQWGVLGHWATQVDLKAAFPGILGVRTSRR